MKNRILQLICCLAVVVGMTGIANAQVADSIDVTFTVDLTVPELAGTFKPDSHYVKVVGGFNGWETANGVGMASIGDHQYSVTVRLDSSANPGTTEYKYILDFNNGDIAWDEPSIDNGVNDNRSFVNDSAMDTNEDGIRELFLDPEVFGIITPIAQIKNLPDGLYVQAEAVVTTPNFESASRTSFFMQQDGVGINIFNFGTPARMVNAGDLVRVQGMVATYKGLKEIILDVPDNDVFTVETGLELPEPRVITFDQFKNASSIETDVDNIQGSLVRMNGLATDPSIWPQNIDASSTNVTATTNDSTVAIRLLAQTEAIGVTPPANIDVIGIVGTYDGAQLHPRFASDIIEAAEELALPEPPYALGDTINYNGSFSGFDLGFAEGHQLGWFFDIYNGSSTYEIVDDSQDGDGKAVKVSVMYDGSAEVWRTQVINEPINVAAGDYYEATFRAKAADIGRKAYAFFGLPEAGDYAELSVLGFDLGTDWTEYTIAYFANEFDAETGMRFGFQLNYAENDGAMIYIDNLRITKQEPQLTDILFSMNVSQQIKLGNFDPDSNSVAVVGEFNGWNTGSPIFLNAENDSVYSGTTQIVAPSIGDTLSYKFILMQNSTGSFEWEANDPGAPNIRGVYSDRYFVVDNLTEVVTPTVYFHGIDPADMDADNYGIMSIADARSYGNYKHLAIQGIVTRATRNFVYLQDATGGTMLFSRDWFGEFLSLGFNQAVANGDIQVGDELKIAGVVWDFNGQHEITRLHGWEVVSTGNPLPAAQKISVGEYSANGEEYESELVRLEYIKLNEVADTLMGGYLYEISDESGTDIGWMAIQGSGNSEWAYQPAPQDLFNFEGVVKEFYLSGIDQRVYAIAPHYYSDIETSAGYFNAAFELPTFAGLVNNTFEYPIELAEIGGSAIEGFRFKLFFDPSVVSLTVDDDQTGTLVDGINLEVNDGTPGELFIGGIAMDGITTTGTLINLTVELLEGGYTDIFMGEVEINEMGILEEPWGAVNVVLRLCGDVTGDETVSSLDAVAALRHSVRLEPEFPLTGLDSTAADVTGNGVITPYDGAKILHYEVGIIQHLACIDLPLKGEPEIANANWILDRNDGAESVINVNFRDSEFDIYSVQFVLEMSEGIAFNAISNLPDNWNVMQNLSDGKMIVSAYGISPIEEKSLELTFDTKSASGLPKVSGDVVLNESKAPELEELVIGEVPTELMLSQNYPNPFNPATNISYSLPDQAKVELSIYNMLGQKVATLVNTTQDVGNYTVTWKADNLSSGVYIYRLTVDSQVFTKRMMLVK